jgi:hypothetical protein
MTGLLSNAGRSFLRPFIGSLLVLLPGVLAAPDTGTMTGLALAALIASVAAGLKAVQVFVPQLSFQSLLPGFSGTLLDSFVRAFLGAFLVLAPGVLDAPNLAEGRALFTAAIVAAVTAGVRALQGFFTQGEPVGNSGFDVADRKRLGA